MTFTVDLREHDGRYKTALPTRFFARRCLPIASYLSHQEAIAAIQDLLRATTWAVPHGTLLTAECIRCARWHIYFGMAGHP